MKVNLRALSIAVAVVLAMLGAVQLAGPESLGISAVAMRWLGIVTVGFGLLQTFLPKAQGASNDPEEMAARIVDMPPSKRQRLEVAVRRREPTPATPPLTRGPEPIFDAGLGREQRP